MTKYFLKLPASLVIALLFFYHTLGFSQSKCFDFQNSKIENPLKDPLSFEKIVSSIKKNPSADVREYGKYPSDKVWGYAYGDVKRPIQDVLKQLYNYQTTKSSNAKFKVVKSYKDPKYLVLDQVNFLIHIDVLFYKTDIEWDEEWGFALVKGTAQKPEKVTVSYQKISGTEYVKHLCGSITLEKMGPELTKVFVFEETLAKNRTDSATGSGVFGTLRTLRDGK